MDMFVLLSKLLCCVTIYWNKMYLIIMKSTIFRSVWAPLWQSENVQCACTWSSEESSESGERSDKIFLMKCFLEKLLSVSCCLVFVFFPPEQIQLLIFLSLIRSGSVLLKWRWNNYIQALQTSLLHSQYECGLKMHHFHCVRRTLR